MSPDTPFDVATLATEETVDPLTKLDVANGARFAVG